MLHRIIDLSLKNKLIVLLLTATMAGFGLFSLTHIPIGAVPDVTNNQVQVITTSRNLSTLDVERFITYPVELSMANLPGLVEIRSISKFGLSVVTLVFEDNMGTYLPRQLITEQLEVAAENIPAGFGKPFMGPISTGLGEIYQYIIEVEPAYKDVYSVSELRTIQDWIVRRQLSGIPGVVEVNTWGGFLKQYEVAVNPEVLHAMDISIGEVYSALETNNSVVGGGYIEKQNQSYFIRGEGLATSVEDLENIVVRNRDGVIIRVQDIANVQFGHATRFGAITANGEGEKVLGQVMMLKGANSDEVIRDVKERVAEVQKSLPEGIHINGFLERSALIKKTTNTIAENLILGCLIVIFVVVLLLGNMRSGLVVASVIPLSLLFALSMMYLFDVDANLMSLGAIDFGIIIDGAVIIVEFIAFQISRNRDKILKTSGIEQQQLIDKITLEGAGKLTRSALFGQLIIIIVFIPILSLSGIEGKMFTPMAQVFTFALLGTMFLGFTYVPVMSSLFLKPPKKQKNISTHLIGFLNRLYEPSISWALSHKKFVLSATVLLLAVSIFIFSRMGGEFIPTLDEGDFVIQPVLKTGTTLSSTIALTTRMEEILKTFPEVKQVVSRIGAAEVPTDPMSMEESDIIITLKPPSEWVTASSKDELANRFKEALSVIPGIDYEFTQPIEMRFNELITGTRADVAIKIFGEDLSQLNQLAQQIKTLISPVEGASDVVVEKVAGLPEMTVKYDLNKLAIYGLTVDDVNRVISMAFAGLKAGEIFEGEKRFDLVIRYQNDYRNDIENLRNTFIPMPDGHQVPLREVAEVNFSKGPAKISRDDTRRRIVVGVNVRGRDMESVVDDVRALIDQHIDLPAGYAITYGGQFENLRSARNRLMIAVPIALLLIFVLLHLAFNSLREALLVYTAIPLSAVGGILLLYFRDMPFSISAGIGFIALFGIAVLNGIVLIEHFKELQKDSSIKSVRELIIKGTSERLRPVLLTASAAALGFLPMAISTSAGAEVQRPLATVVVGGLITATLLTLIVLPVLFCLFERKKIELPAMKNSAIVLLLVSLFAFPWQAMSQEKISLEQAMQKSLERHAGLKAATLSIEQAKLGKTAAFDFPKTAVYYNFDENNMADNGLPLKIWGIQQSFAFPGVYAGKNKLAGLETDRRVMTFELTKKRLQKEVSLAYYDLSYQLELQRHFHQLDSLYQRLQQAVKRRVESGERPRIELLQARASRSEIENQLQRINKNLKLAQQQLASLMQTDTLYLPVTAAYKPIVQVDSIRSASWFGLLEKDLRISEQQHKISRRQMLPDLQLEYFTGTNAGANSKVYNGFQVGIEVPLLFFGQHAQNKSARIQTEILAAEQERLKFAWKQELDQLYSQLAQAAVNLDSYANEWQPLANELQTTAVKSLEQGEISLLAYLQLMREAIRIRQSQLEWLHEYNRIVLSINYFTP
ncbi:MAG: CusA/CzcA family heavy metal efflux RND transporter [Bacteroidetes bacterium]|nr:CusA/CzcA family heavy metal efflux RND transporter [Bacteroidota bacterium]